MSGQESKRLGVEEVHEPTPHLGSSTWIGLLLTVNEWTRFPSVVHRVLPIGVGFQLGAQGRQSIDKRTAAWKPRVVRSSVVALLSSRAQSSRLIANTINA